PGRPDAAHRLEGVGEARCAAVEGLRAVRDVAHAGRFQRQHDGARVGRLRAGAVRAPDYADRLGGAARLRGRLFDWARDQWVLPGVGPAAARTGGPSFRPAGARTRGAGGDWAV